MTLFGWILRLALGFLFAAQAPAWIGAQWLPVLTLINALGLHVLFTALSEQGFSPRQLRPYAVLLGVALLSAPAIASALPANGCATCLSNGNDFWYCVMIYGLYCF